MISSSLAVSSIMIGSLKPLVCRKDGLKGKLVLAFVIVFGSVNMKYGGP